MSVATPSSRGWRLGLEKVGDLGTLFARLRSRGDHGPVALGIDAPIGLPLAYAGSQADFPAFLRALAPDAPFFDVCDDPAEIGPGRPFYPRRSRPGVRRSDLLRGLGIAESVDLLRQCERRQGTQPAASPMFWTLGANQAGKGALCLWRDLLIPALRAPSTLSLWPFDGPLASLLQRGRVVVAETYPANAMRQMNLSLRGSKRRQTDRRATAAAFGHLMGDLAAEPDPELAAAIDDGFGTAADGEDRFDSLIGLLRMLQVIADPALDQRPEPAICRCEGWILGRPLSIS